MVEISLFGPLSVRGRGACLGPRDFGGVKPKQILEILVLARGRAVTKDRLADLLWGEDLPRNVSATLETYVSVLRRCLGKVSGPGVPLVLTERGGYRLDSSRCRIDLDRFDELVRRASAAGAAQAAIDVRAAVGLVAGEVLADEPYAPWAQEPREMYLERFTELLIRAARDALAARDFEAALAYARQATEVAPLREDAWRTAMLALYALSRRSSALRAFDRCQAILAEDLGVEPSTETHALREAILHQQDPATLLPVAPAAPQLDAWPPGRDAGRPAVPLYGRAHELAQIAGLVEEAFAGAFTLVLVEGEAGIGKTRLLEEASRATSGAHRGVRVGAAGGNALERRLPGVVMAAALRQALGDVPGFEDVLRAAAQGRGGEGWLAMERLAEAVAAAAPILLVLDDIHDADTMSLSTLAFLRRRCPTAAVAVLAASRPEEVAGNHPLRRIEVEARFALDVLRPEDVPGAAPALLAKTGGHPQLLSACLTEGWFEGTPWPAALVETVLRRSQALGPRTHRILVTASVFPGSFGAEDLGELLDVPAIGLIEDLEGLCERRLLAAQGARFAFVYEAVREVLLGSMSPARRELLTRRLGTAAEATRVLARVRSAGP